MKERNSMNRRYGKRHTLARSTANPMTDSRKSTFPLQVSRSSPSSSSPPPPPPPPAPFRGSRPGRPFALIWPMVVIARAVPSLSPPTPFSAPPFSSFSASPSMESVGEMECREKV
uniref:Uncharacterized protein n=1 Tax=Anopheles merus TaxID=30066 RepID=A0A182V151_ANOME